MRVLSRIFLGAALFAVTSTVAMAQTIQSLSIEGNERVEDATVRSYLNVGEGDVYSPDDVSGLIKSLYKTGLFRHVEVDWNGSNLIIRVDENPLVNKIAFEGNEALDDDRLKEMVSLKSRSVYTLDRVQRDVRDILAAYRQSGRFLAEVTPQIIERDQNRVDVIYKISESEKTKIRSIRFVGNERFSDSDLKNVIMTRESRWWRFLSSTDVYDQDRTEVDKELLRRYYIEAGYADFRVTSAVTELSKDKKSFFVTFTLDEGVPYNFGNVDVRLEESGEDDLNAEELLDVVDIKKGARYNGVAVERDIDDLVDHLGSKGYAFLDVRPTFNQDEANQTIGVTYNVVPGPRVYVNRINIRGNTRTREHVIRREMRFSEGDAFSSNKLKRSRDRINYLGYFENVNVNTLETDSPDRVDVEIDVSEQSTGEFNVGAGYSTYEGALATTSIRERNFLGKGQDLSLGFNLSKRRQLFNFAFTEPYFLGQELAATTSAFNEEIDMQDESSYDLGRKGGGLSFGIPMNEYTRNTIGLSFKETDIHDVQSDASRFVQRDSGKKTAVILSNTYAIDTRDSALNPTHGHRIALTGEYSGFGTDVEYLKGQVNASWHREMKKDWVLSLGGTVGYMEDIGDSLPVYEHFKSGGSNLRGFEYSGIGPRDRVSGDALGGRIMVGNSVEMTFPLGNTFKEMGVHGLLFSDGGIVTEFDDDPDVLDDESYRVSVGAGVYWRSPMGPLRFEFGFPVMKASEDKTQIFSFSFGTRF